VRSWRLPDGFNSKPYHAAAPALLSDIAIAHFHGPKPSDYLRFAATKECRFGGLCAVGMRRRACALLRDWVRCLEGEEGAEDLPRQWREACGGDRAIGG